MDLQVATDRTLFGVIALLLTGTLARFLISPEPLCWRRFAGEMLLSVIGGVVIFNFGLLQGMSAPEIILVGALSSLGGLRLVEWAIKIITALKQGS